MTLSSHTAAPADFDFIIGDWHVRHRRLNSRLTGCTDWTEFKGMSSTRKILGGFGNVEDNLLCFPEAEVRAADGTFFAAVTLDGKPITVRFTWHSNPGGRPRWEQAFSGDAGSTWETNWVMEFKRSEA